MLDGLTPADLPAALALTQAQNWSHQMHDWALHLRLGRGFGARDADGSLLGTAIWWDWGAALATLGLVVVRPDAQGRGIGRRLMHAILGETGARDVGLVATNAGLKLYQDCGFVTTGGVLQCQGTVRGRGTTAPAGLRLRALRPTDRDTLLALDAAATGAGRAALLDAILSAGMPALVAEDAGGALGYALLRPAGRGVTVGPLVARDEQVAIALATAALDQVEGLARLDVPAAATALVAALESRGLVVVDRVTAMLRGPAPAVRGDVQRFGLASQAFG